MKNRKYLLLVASLFATISSFASSAAGTVQYPDFGLPRVEQMMFLVMQVGVIIIAARLGGMFAAKLKMPSILGELAAGIVIGPWALGGIGFGDGIFASGLFHGAELKKIMASGSIVDATSPALYGIATIASITLLFLSGLETNLKLFLKYSFVGSMVGLGGVVFSFFLGDLSAVYLLPYFFDSFKNLSELPLSDAMTQSAPLYMGIMSTATSVGITARILSEKKKMDSEEGVTIMAGAVIDDVLGLIVLAVGNGIIATQVAAGSGATAGNGMNWGEIGIVAVKAFGVWLGATLVGIVFARYIAKFLKKTFKQPIVISTMAFSLSLILAAFFECMGLAMIIGAYVMGLALSRTDLKHLIQEMLSPIYAFLVPVFFCVMGMMVDVTKLCSEQVLVFGAIYTVLAIIAKIVGCMVPSLFCGFNLLGGLRIGTGMVPRGEVALIIAGLGLSYGYLTQEIFGIGIMMTLVTTIVAPPALVGLFAPKAKGVKRSRPSNEGSREIRFELPGSDVADLMLTKLVEEFRNEGFFTSLLSKADNIWNIAMDNFEISIRRERRVISVSCTPAEEAILMTAWMEVASKMNNLAKSIAKPIRTENVDKMLSDQKSAVGNIKSGVGRYMQSFVMIPKFKASSKIEAIEKMVSQVAESCPERVSDVSAATEAVLKREASMPTGLDHGIAVPHGRSPSVTGIVGAVALVDNSDSAGGVIADYETIDNSRVDIIVLTLANDTEQAPYLQLMSFVSKALRVDDGYKKLLQCNTADEMRRFFRSVK